MLHWSPNRSVSVVRHCSRRVSRTTKGQRGQRDNNRSWCLVSLLLWKINMGYRPCMFSFPPLDKQTVTSGHRFRQQQRAASSVTRQYLTWIALYFWLLCHLFWLNAFGLTRVSVVSHMSCFFSSSRHVSSQGWHRVTFPTQYVGKVTKD